MNSSKWIMYIGAILSGINLLVIIYFYSRSIKHNEKMQSFYTDQLIQSEKRIHISAKEAQRTLLFNYLSLYSDNEALEGRRLMYLAAHKGGPPDGRGSGTKCIRKACELYDLLGMLIESKVISLSDVSSTLGEQAYLCWIAMTNKGGKHKKSILDSWREEHGEGYLSQYETLMQKYPYIENVFEVSR